MLKVEVWPEVAPEPWWFRDCSPTWKSMYCRALEKKALRESQIESWPGPDLEPHWYRSAPAWIRRIQLDIQQREIDRRNRSKLYLRFGEAPQSGLSLASLNKHGPDEFEKGVSVFRAFIDSSGAYIVDTSNNSLQTHMYVMCVVEGRTAYLAEGEEIASGSDGEPVLRNPVLTPLPEGTKVRCLSEMTSAQRFSFVSFSLAMRAGRSMPITLDADALPEIVVGSEVGTLTPAQTLGEFTQKLLEASTIKSSRLHGEEHWKRVALAGVKIAEMTPGADPVVILLFALLHDSMRIYDDKDSWHGLRAARLARTLLNSTLLVDDIQLQELLYTLEEHDNGLVTENPTVGACWDADRLNLWRVGSETLPRLLSTEAAKRTDFIEWARAFQGEPVTWANVREAFDPYLDHLIAPDRERIASSAYSAARNRHNNHFGAMFG